ncbi:hypothetical protein BGW80DRAFT_1339737 [Lactifluus volemus]|nr:hypothetical protein BGW80DRAFT_1339737 [Lactifluus volemus]
MHRIVRRLATDPVRVPLPYEVEHGMGDFLPPAALKLIAEDYQQGLLDRLNEQIKGTNLENMSVAQIVISTAPHESQTLAFNYASLALNNSFFLHHLKPPPTAYTHPDGVIASQMGSLQALKTYVTAAVTGMLSSNGFVWLVTDATGRLGIVPTYGAGTLLVHDRRQSYGFELGGTYQPAENPTSSPPPPPPISSSPSSPFTSSSPTHEQPTASSPTSGLAHPPLHGMDTPPSARALTTSASRAFRGTVISAANGGNSFMRPMNVWSDPSSSSSPASSGVDIGDSIGPEGPTPIPTLAPASLDTLGQTLYPLFCVSVHEHAWIAAGYGVWGVETYMDRFWTCLDWAAVQDSYARYACAASLIRLAL